MPFRILTFAAALGLAFLAATQANAGLNFCNNADVQHSFAVAYKDGDNWRSVGWWNIDPGECKLVIGGDLQRRYYYYRATATGRTFNGDDYYFCTRQEAYEAIGEQGNCPARGYDKSEFRKLDTGKTARDFTLNLVPAGGDAVTPAPAPAPAPAPGNAPGTYGEPYSNAAILQECISGDGPAYCAFHADGTKLYVYDDGRTPQFVLTAMRALDPGTPIAVSGDLVEVFDATAEVVLRDITVRPYSDNDWLLKRMQGYWYAVDDPNAQFNILGAERENQYDGQMMGLEFLSVQNWCDDSPGNGPFLVARDPETGEAFCYGIEHVGDFDMTLMFLPRGNFLEFRKLD